VINKLNAAAKKAAKNPDFAKKVEQEGLVVTANRPRGIRSLREGPRSPLAKDHQGKQHQA
jgi:hypothetical protein